MSTPLMALSFFIRVTLGLLLSLLNLLKSYLHLLFLFGELLNGGCKSLDLLGQGCGIGIGLHPKQKLMKTMFSNINLKISSPQTAPN